MDSFASIAELAGRLPFDMDAQEEREAQGALEDLTQDAIFFGRASWTTTNVPYEVKNLVVRAAARHMKNHEGFTSSRAGDESVAWTDRGEQAGSAYFTVSEKKKLQLLAGNTRSGFHTIGMQAWGRPERPHEHVSQPLDHRGDEVTYFASEEPW